MVDDDPLQCLIVRRIAERAGFAVDSVLDLTAAAHALAHASYATIVLDLSLGREDGLTLLHSIAGAERPPQLILISGFDDRIRQAASRLAATLGIAVAGSLHKPIKPSDLAQVLGTEAAGPTAIRDAPAPPLTRDHLLAALAHGEVELAFQPKVDMATRKAVGVEALARWTSPSLGEIPPMWFIPAFEQHGLIGELTDQLLAKAFASCAQWRCSHPEIVVAVNVSPLSLRDIEFPERVEARMESAGLPPGALVLEVTESSIFSDDLVATEVLTRLRIKGIALSIDDFGTGYSSLLSLLRMPFGELKIDRSFTCCCDTDQDAWKIVQASLFLAHEFGMVVTAEGIETEAVATRLRNAGCDIGQGWLYGHAMGLPALQDWLAAQ